MISQVLRQIAPHAGSEVNNGSHTQNTSRHTERCVYKYTYTNHFEDAQTTKHSHLMEVLNVVY
jgi:hypothetical protein